MPIGPIHMVLDIDSEVDGLLHPTDDQFLDEIMYKGIQTHICLVVGPTHLKNISQFEFGSETKKHV